MKCENCEIEHNGDYGSGRFCSSKCARSFSTKKKRKEINEKVSSRLSGRKLTESHKEKIKGEKNGKWKGHCKIEYVNCKVCGYLFTQKRWGNRKTCSESCRIIASTERTYRNGSRKTINYRGVVLESTWELRLAEWLDEKNIKWERPKPIKWVDNKEKERMYYPDFYLPEHDLYLDPKNPHCMVLDREKMYVIENKVKIIYGDIEELINKIESVV